MLDLYFCGDFLVSVLMLQQTYTSILRELIALHLCVLTVMCMYHITSRSGSDITPCIKICKPLVVYLFSGNVMK